MATDFTKLGKRSRTKGAAWERALANILKAIWPDAKRGIGQSRWGGEVPDVDGTVFWIEAKVGQQPNMRGAMRQAEEASDGRPCIAVVKDNSLTNKPADVWVVMRFDTFVQLVLAESNDIGGLDT